MRSWKQTARLLLCFGCAAVTAALYANSGSNAAVPNPPLKRTGAAVDGGLNCTACHVTFAPADSDPRGKITLRTSAYKPGVKQLVHVRVEHPEAARWGFQLTARVASDPARTAGSFTQTDSVQVKCDDGSVRGVAGPCNGQQLEFAMQTAASTRQGTREGVDWEVEWTPPATDVGAVVLYAAGNAADGTATNANDRIYTTSLNVASDAGCTLTERPRVTSVSAWAGGRRELGINALASIFGSGFAAAGSRKEATSADFEQGRYPRELTCVAVEVAGQRAPLLYADSGQIDFQVPTVVLNGPVAVRVILNPGRSNEISETVSGVPMQEWSPSLFLVSGNSLAARTTAEGTPIGANDSVAPGARPARPGEMITLFGTGFGVSDPVYQAGEVAPAGRTPVRDEVRVTMGGVTLAPENIAFIGLVPGSISGYYQLQVRVPANAPDGNLAVSVSAYGVPSPAGTFIPVRR